METPETPQTPETPTPETLPLPKARKPTATDPALPSLPPGTDKKILQEQWSQYAKMRKDGKHLSKPEWEAFLQLTRQLSTVDDSGIDYWQAADDAGAFDVDQVPRPSKAQMIVRVATVADWIQLNRPMGEMLSEAKKRWGVGYHSLNGYKKRAAKLIYEYANVSRDEMMAQALRGVSDMMGMAREAKNGDVMDKAVLHLRKIGGLDRATVQEIRVGNPDGSAWGVFEMPERKTL